METTPATEDRGYRLFGTDEDIPFTESPVIHLPAFEQQRFDWGERIEARCSVDQLQLLQPLIETMSDELGLILVLVASRNELLKEGRYQSGTPVSREWLSSWLSGPLKDPLEQDGRCAVWVIDLRPGDGPRQIIWDRHDRFFVYGGAQGVRETLAQVGLTEQPLPPLPTPHTHRYHSRFDNAFDRVLSMPDWWVYSELRDEDAEL
ncbi:MAG: hypothetical protein AAGG07_11020 [Planctomycetota bacterium]